MHFVADFTPFFITLWPKDNTAHIRVGNLAPHMAVKLEMLKQGILLLCLMFMMMFSSCRGSSSQRERSQGMVVDVAQAFTTDSLKYSLDSLSCHSEVCIDYPTDGPKAAVDAIRSYIKAVLFDETPPASNDPRELVRTYCERSIHAQSQSMKQMGTTPVSRYDGPEEGVEIRKVWQTDRVVTYEVYRFSYFTDGAHGEYSEYGVTWRLSDGKRLNEHILREVDQRLYVHIREGLKNYFEVSSDDELKEICTVDLSLMPMPTFPPYLVADGVRFHYSIYDLCDFDHGDPAFTIPYDVIRPYLSEEALELISGER